MAQRNGRRVESTHTEEVAVYERKEPILASPGRSDYERYIRTDELLALQPEPATWRHRDELLFTVVHQTSELWLKLAAEEITEALAEVQRERVLNALQTYFAPEVGPHLFDGVALFKQADRDAPFVIVKRASFGKPRD